MSDWDRGGMPTDPTAVEALGHLRVLTGRDDARFRPGQLEAIRLLVEERRRVLVVQRTGWGKSAVYFIATRMLRDRHLGPTILISPLLALMDNQVDAAKRMGVRAVTINSTNTGEWDDLRDRLMSNEIDLLLISEQRLNNDQFRNEWLPQLGRSVGMLVVDEVHCISDWGHDFRPHYRRIGRFLQLLAPNVPVVGCTATANDRVVSDVVAQFGDSIVTIRGALRRDGLRLEVHTDKPRRSQRMAWLGANINDLPGTGIVYCLTRRDVIEVAEYLRRSGIVCGTYVGGGDEFEILEKQQTLDRFLANEIKCVVATSALGMGYDKPDVGFVVHYQMPQSAIAYYQQVGRAGRSLDEAYGILLAGDEDHDIHEWFISRAFSPPDQVASVLEVLEDADLPVRETSIAAKTNISASQIKGLLIQLDVEGAVTKEKSRWQRTLLPWSYPHQRVEMVNAWRRSEQGAMDEYLRLETCRMAFLQYQLDDPPTDRCGLCDNCTGVQFGQVPPATLVSEARSELRNRHIEVPPRARWPVGLSEVSGVIAEDERAETGWCLAHWGDGGWGEQIRPAKQAHTRFSDEVVAAFAEFLQHQPLDAQPQWIASVPSIRNPGLVSDLAARLGDHLNLPVSSTIIKTRETPPQKAMANSQHQVTNILGVFELTRGHPIAPCFLVDDIIDSRWTATVVARMLRRSGVASVTPVALAYAGQSDQ